MEVGGRRSFVLVAVQAIDCCVVGVHDHHRHGGSCRDGRIDVPGGVMTGGANVMMG